MRPAHDGSEPHPHHDLLRDLLAAFPPVRWAFGYGSGVFKQPGLYGAAGLAGSSSAAGTAAAAGAGATGAAGPAAGGGRGGDCPMLDFVFVVDDPEEWHAQARRRLGEQETGRTFRATAAGRQAPGARAAAAPAPPAAAAQTIKYGVASLACLQADLLHWATLYLAGRLHKPVLPLVAPPPAVAAAQRANLEAALRAALLLLPPRFGQGELLHAICGLSYSGDVRMGLAEDSRKVHRIVAGSHAQLRELYAAPLQEAAGNWGVLQQLGPRPLQAANGGLAGTGAHPRSWRARLHLAGGEHDAWEEEEMWAQDDSPAARTALLAALPSTVLARLAGTLHLRAQQLELAAWQCAPLAPGTSAPAPGAAADVAAAWAAREPSQRLHLLRGALASVVRDSSWRQAALGLLSAGPLKSARYALAKLRKALK
eukprot:scaffold14.g1272.t1